jgi:hypothetical protein
LLRALDALPARDDAAVLRCVRDTLQMVPDDTAAQRAMQVVLRTLVEGDAAILHPEHVSDVMLRESLRVALDWARALPVAMAPAADAGESTEGAAPP